MAVTVPALLSLAAAVAGLLVRRWWLVAVASALVLVASAAGSFPTSAAFDGLDAMALVAGMVVVAAAADRSGLLAAAAGALTARFRRPRSLLAVTFLLAVAVTTVANLDTAAVLFTPVAVEIGAAIASSVVPFALAAVLAANFGSMLLPTSNLTNLVVWRHTDQTFAAFAAERLPLAIAAVAVTLVALLAVGGRERPHAPEPPPRAANPLADRVLARWTAVAIVVLVVAFFAGVPVGPAALIAALALIGLRPELRRDHVDPRLVVAVLALFCAAGLVASSLDTASRLDHTGPVGLALLGATLASIGTNLVATLVLVPVATTASLRNGLLIGVNLGVGFTPVASLATVLWRDSLRGRGVPTPWRAYFALAAPLSIVFLALSALLR